MQTSLHPLVPRPRAPLWLRLLTVLSLPALAFAQSGTGTLTGRVFNPATQEYVRNAEVRIQGTNQSVFTDGDGSYRFSNAPAGTATVTVSYTGYEAAAATVAVTAGAVATRDFELTGSAATTRQGDQIVTLSAFTVSTEREGSAKAIMDQKAAMNVKTVVAADSFGEIAEGNIGEFLKFMPGLTIDYVETDTRAARMGGLEARYGGVTLDGNSVANAGGASRQFEFEAMSINNIEAIEVNKTLSADMPADNPAGSINLRTKSALDRKGQQFNFTVALIGNQYEHSLSQTPRPDDAKHAKSRPTFVADYSNAFFGNKLGVSFNTSYSSVFKPQYRFSPATDYTSAAAQARRAPIITALNFKDGTKMTDKYSFGLKLDYQPFGRQLRFTLTSSYTDFNDKIANRNLGFAVNAAQSDPTSTLTRIVARQAPNTRINHSGGHGNKQIDTSNLAVGFVYRGSNYVLDGQAAYSRARLQNGSDHLGQVDRADVNLQNVAFTAERPSVDSTAWTFTQTAGRDWFNLDNYLLSNAVTTARTKTKTQQFSEQVNLRYNLPWTLPTFFKTGLYHQTLTRAVVRKNQRTQTWVGPSGAAATSPVPRSIAEFRISPAFGGNIYSMPVPDKTVLFNMLTTNPTYFTRSESQMAGDLDAILGDGENVKEEIRAAYLMGNTRFGKLQLQAGLRYEDTATTAITPRRLPDSRNPFPANTVNRILARWSQGRETSEGSYDDILPSAAASYRFSENLQLKAGYHQAIKRAPLDQLAGGWDIDEANQRISVPNPNLGPERSDKVSLMLEYYFEPAGTASIHVFETNLENNSQRTDWLPASEFGYGSDPVYGLFEFRGWENFPGTRKVRGMELNYTQQLSFFRNEFLRGTRVFATYSRYTSKVRPNNFVPESASAGVSFRFRNLTSKLAGTWTPDVWTGSNTVSAAATNTYFYPGDREARKERYIFDIDFGYKLTRRFEVFVSGRNAFNAPIVWYFPNSDQRIRQKERFGGQWTLGLKGRF